MGTQEEPALAWTLVVRVSSVGVLGWEKGHQFPSFPPIFL